jgi:hypothetical protein
MTESAAGQGRMVSDLNVDIQIGAEGGIEIVFIKLVRVAPIEVASIVPRYMDVI